MLRVLGWLLRQGHLPAIVGTSTVWREEYSSAVGVGLEDSAEQKELLLGKCWARG